MQFKPLLIAAASVAAFASAPASATIIFDLDQTFTAGMGTPPFGKVTLTKEAGDVVDVDVVLSPGYEFVKTGSHNAFTFNIAGAHTVTNIVATPFPGTPPAKIHPYVWSASGSNPSFGSYTDKITCSACGNGGAGAFAIALSFKVNMAGITEASFSKNAAGYYFSADLLNKSNGNTGAVGAIAPEVPEPGTYAMLAAGLGAMGFIARRRKAA